MTNNIALSFEDRLIEKECTNPIDENSITTFIATPQETLALNMISIYESYGVDEVYQNPFNVSALTFEEMINNDEEVVDKLNEKYFFYGDFNSKSDKTKTYVEFRLRDTFLHNYMLEEYGYPKDTTTRVLFMFYIQSFIDSYNELENNGTHLLFSSKEEVKKRAMKNNESSLLNFLKIAKNLYGFSQETFVYSEIPLETQLDRVKNKEIAHLLNQ